MILGFVEISFYIYSNDHLIYIILEYIYMMHDTLGVICATPSLHLWTEAYLTPHCDESSASPVIISCLSLSVHAFSKCILCFV